MVEDLYSLVRLLLFELLPPHDDATPNSFTFTSAHDDSKESMTKLFSLFLAISHSFRSHLRIVAKAIAELAKKKEGVKRKIASLRTAISDAEATCLA